MRVFIGTHLLLILFLNSSLLLFGNNSSPNRNLANEVSDTAKITALLNLANKYSTSDKKKALNYIAQARKIAGVHRKRENADILLVEGKVFRLSSDLQQAIENLDKAIVIYTDLEIQNKIAESYLLLGNVYFDLSKYSEAQSYYYKAIKIFSTLKDLNGVSRCYNYMAMVYSFQTRYQKAIEYSKRSLMLTDKTNKYELARQYLKLAILYRQSGDYKKTISLEDSIFPALKQANDLNALAKANITMSNIYFDLKDFKKSKAYILNAISCNTQLGNQSNIILTNVNLSRIYNSTNNIDSAIYILNYSLALNKSNNNVKLYQLIYFNLFEIYEKIENAKMALETYKKYKAYNDSTERELNAEKLLELEALYKVDSKNKQIELLQKEKQTTKQRKVIFALSSIILLSIGLIFFIHKQQKTQEKQLIYKAKLKEAADKIDFKNRELINKAMHLSRQEQILNGIKEQLLNISIENQKSKEALIAILSNIDLNLKQNTMVDFEKYFIEVHPEFFNRLKQKYPNLTTPELKICAFLRLNLSSKEIANITYKSLRSVENSRTIIRKKMELNKENLYDTLLTI